MHSSHQDSALSNQRKRAVRVLCIYGSPRVRGNTDVLMDAFVQGVTDGGGAPEPVYLRNLKISPCREIYACRQEGICALRDDMTALYDALRDADALALASPVMFYGVSAHTKAFIDRCQAFWCLKYVAGRPVSRSPHRLRKGVFLSVGGSLGKRIFEGPELTFRYFLDAVDAVPWRSLTYRGIDEKGEMNSHAEALAEAREAGRALVEAVQSDRSEAGDGSGG